MNANLARAFGLRAGNALDEKLASAIANPKSKCSERFVYSRGNAAIFISGMYLFTVGYEGQGRRWLADKAEDLPEFPHLKIWAESL